MTISQLRTYARRWQRRMKLQEWDITVRWMTRKERAEYPDWNGFCTWSEQHKLAAIAISKESDDIRHTVCHELLHLRWSGHAPQTDSPNVPEEVAINALADLFCSLERDLDTVWARIEVLESERANAA